MELKQIWILAELCPVKGVCVQMGVSHGWAGIGHEIQHATMGIMLQFVIPPPPQSPTSVRVQFPMQGDPGSSCLALFLHRPSCSQSHAKITRF